MYNKVWHEAQVGLEDLLTVEMPQVPPKPERVSRMHDYIADYMVVYIPVPVLYV